MKAGDKGRLSFTDLVENLDAVALDVPVFVSNIFDELFYGTLVVGSDNFFGQ